MKDLAIVAGIGIAGVLVLHMMGQPRISQPAPQQQLYPTPVPATPASMNEYAGYGALIGGIGTGLGGVMSGIGSIIGAANSSGDY